MKFKAISTFTIFHDDQMHVCNAGETGDLPDEVVAPYIASGLAEPARQAKTVKAAKAEADAPAAADQDAPPA